MLEVRKNTFSKNYENTFFREFAKYLSTSFSETGKSGLLIGSPFCEIEERLQIDALLITKHVVCIIDFKNFGGQINIPVEKDFELGIWSNNEGEQIKGGSSINPFIQLKNQKRRFSDVYNNHISNNLSQGDKLECKHVVSIVCFQKEVTLNRQIPSSRELAFWIIDRLNFVEKIKDIVDVVDREVLISEKSYDSFKKIFKADLFKIDDKPLEDKLKDFAEKSTSLDYSLLNQDQNSALTEIKSFLENPNQNVFILQGTSNSGKTFLIPYIQDVAFKIGIQETEIFASSSRVANNLMSTVGVDKVNSIYSYIYGGKNAIKDDKDKNTNDEGDEVKEEIQLESIPLKSCDNSENALFIVDEAQLVSDSFHQSIDLIFGSGYVLKDFINFTDFKNSNRKLIFIGDPYQLHIGKSDETPLNPSYLDSAYSLSTCAYQLLDKPEFSICNKESLVCVDAIRSQSFNFLRFTENDSFQFLSREMFKDKITEMIRNDSGHLLYFSNDDSHKANLWIKNKILNNGSDLAKGDVVYFNNNISVENEDDPNATPKRLYNGQFATIINPSSDIISKAILNKKKEIIATLNFRLIDLLIQDNGNQTSIISFENYRHNSKGELSKNELLAYKIFLYELAEDEVPNFKGGKYKCDDELSSLFNSLNEGKRVRTKINSKVQSLLRQMPSTPYYKFKNAALLRFGWAMTVHKSMSYKWNEIVFNVEPGENIGKTNQQHFKWLYTGLSRAKQKVFLINYKQISPFDHADLIDNNSNSRQTDFLYISDTESISERLSEFKYFIETKLFGSQFQIVRVENLSFQERYHFTTNNQSVVLSFIYNAQGRFKMPTLTSGSNEIGQEIIQIITRPSDNFNFEIIKDNWRRKCYEFLNEYLNVHSIRFGQVIQTNYKDRIKFIRGQDELDVELDYNGDGAFTKIRALYHSSSELWTCLKESILKSIE